MATASENIITLEDGIAVRPYRESDAPSLSRHATNPKIKANLRGGFPYPYTEADALTWRARCLEPENMLRAGPWTAETGSQGPLTLCHYAITVNDEAVGSIGLVPFDNIYFRTAELGYWLGEEHWGKGVMSRVATAFVAWAWKTFGVLGRINSGADEENKGSQGVLRKAGFVYEGRRENVAFKNGGYVTEVMYGLVRPS